MSPALIHGKVDIAIARLGMTGPLVEEWHEVAGRYGAGSNPARGCLLALVRQAWGHPDANACKTSDGRFWGIRCPGFGGYMGTGLDEDEALVDALEAASDGARRDHA